MSKVKFPDPDRPPLPDPATIWIYLYGDKKSKAADQDKVINALLEEYGSKGKRSLDLDGPDLECTIARKYLAHAIRKLTMAGFNAQERTNV